MIAGLTLFSGMKKIVFFLCVAVWVFSCGHKRNVPDVSGISVQLDTLRFDRDFFSMDTTNMEVSLDALQKKYPKFINDYLYGELEIQQNKDSVIKQVKLFINEYKDAYTFTAVKYPSIQKVQADVKSAFQFIKYYFPTYKLPSTLITFIGPWNGDNSIYTSDAIGTGLQMYLGKDFPVYNTPWYVSDIHATYQSRRFEPEYIATDCIKNIILDIYPEGKANLPLAYQMVEAGKRMYVLDYLMPETPDTIKIGYTQKQLKGCYDNETAVWNYFVQNDNLLYVTDPGQTKDYMADGPKTEALGDESPGFIGQFVGWQIVKKWMAQDDKRTLVTLLQTPPKQIFEEAKYKPR